MYTPQKITEPKVLTEEIVLSLIGNMLKKAANPAQALELIERFRAAQKKRGLPVLFGVPLETYYGQALSELDRHDEAIAHLRATIAREPAASHTRKTHIRLARALHRAGRGKEALAYIKKSMEQGLLKHAPSGYQFLLADAPARSAPSPQKISTPCARPALTPQELKARVQACLKPRHG